MVCMQAEWVRGFVFAKLAQGQYSGTQAQEALSEINRTEGCLTDWDSVVADLNRVEVCE